MKQQVDFSRIAARPYVPAIDVNDNLVYVSPTAWWYVDSDGSIVLDWKRFVEWEKKTGYAVVPEPFVRCEEEDECYNDWRDCDNFALYRNYEVVELNEKGRYVKVARSSDGVVFKVCGEVFPYFLLELENGTTLCEAIALYSLLLAKLGKLSKEDEELLDRDPAGLLIKHGNWLISLLNALGVTPGLIAVQRKEK